MDHAVLHAIRPRRLHEARPVLDTTDVPRCQVEFGCSQHPVSVPLPGMKTHVRLIFPQTLWAVQVICQETLASADEEQTGLGHQQHSRVSAPLWMVAQGDTE